jgi:hypothetical protein
MVLVTRASRRRGIATALLKECISQLVGAGRIPVLDATPAGREVYKPLGFRDGWPLQRWRRRVNKHLPVPTAVRRMNDLDWKTVLALDAAAFGCDRSPLLQRLRERSARFACVTGNRGFLLGRDGRIATHLGPIVAADEAAASALVAHALERLKGEVIVDALERHAGFASSLAAQGFERERPYTRMALGQDELFGDPSRTFAIAGPELG